MDERIEDYLENKLSPTEKARFEADVKSDPVLADAFAMYVNEKTAAKELQKKITQADVNADLSIARSGTIYNRLRIWYAIAAVFFFLAFGTAWYFMKPPKTDMAYMATEYSEGQFLRLNAATDNQSDSLHLAASKYNDGQYATSTKICDLILQREPTNPEAKRIAGIVSLRLLDYEKAIAYFHQLGEQKELHRNPGKFYEAIALLQSGLPANKEKAETLLHEVVDHDLPGKEEASQWF